LAAGVVPDVVDALTHRHPRISLQVTEAGFIMLQRDLRDR
jgi:hypothetical protein